MELSRIPRFEAPVRVRHFRQGAVPRGTLVQRHDDPPAAACQPEPLDAALPAVVAVGPSHHGEYAAGASPQRD